MRRSLVGFESPNFGHAFLDGFDDLDTDEDTEDVGYFGDEPVPSRAPRGGRGVEVGRNRTRVGASESTAISTTNNGLRDLPSNKWQDKHSPDGDNACFHLLTEPEPSLDDRLVAPPPDWAMCCVCHEVFKKPTTTMCGHSFCYGCIIEVIHRKGTCPLCRHPIGLNEITEDKQANQAISGLTVRCKYGLRLVSPPSLPIASSFSSSSSSSSLSSIASSAPTSHLSSLFPTTSTASTNPHTPHTPHTTPHTATQLHAATVTSTATSRGSTSSPILIRSPNANHSMSHARSLPSALPSFMRTAAKWAPFANACDSTFPLAQQAAHENECPHRPVACYNDGCNEKVKNMDLELHMKTCARRVVQCFDCKDMLLMVDENTHIQACPEKEIGCPYKCNAKVRRKEQADHQAVCTNFEVVCPHAQYGCTFKGIRALYAEHQASCLFKGIAVVLGGLAQQVAQLALDNKNQAHTIASLQQELRTTQTQVREQAAEIRILRDASSARPSLFSRDTLFE